MDHKAAATARASANVHARAAETAARKHAAATDAKEAAAHALDAATHTVAYHQAAPPRARLASAGRAFPCVRVRPGAEQHNKKGNHPHQRKSRKIPRPPSLASDLGYPVSRCHPNPPFRHNRYHFSTFFAIECE